MGNKSTKTQKIETQQQQNSPQKNNIKVQRRPKRVNEKKETFLQMVDFLKKRSEFIDLQVIFIKKSPESFVQNLNMSDLTLEKNLSSKLILCSFREKLFILKSIKKFKDNECNNEILIFEYLNSCQPNKYMQKYYTTMKYQKQEYLLLEYIQGLELYELMRYQGLFQIEQSKFLMAQFFTIIEFLHDKCIVYRDFRPENLIIQQNGYIKLINFRNSKKLIKKLDSTLTLVGFPHYIAPELILGESHGIGADYWSVGVCIYELTVGGLPFGNQSSNPIEIYEEIIRGELNFPFYFQKEKLKSLLKHVLCKDQVERYNFSAKDSEFFQNFDWKGIQNQTMKSPLNSYIYQDKISETRYLRNHSKKMHTYLTSIQQDNQ